MESKQYFPLTAFSPSLALISSQLSAGSSVIVPRETINRVCSEDLLLVETNNQRNNLAWFSGALTPIGSCKPGKYLNFTCSYFYTGITYRERVCPSVCMAKLPFCFHFLILVIDWVTVKNSHAFFFFFLPERRQHALKFIPERRQHVLKFIQNQKVRPVLLTCSSVTRLANNFLPFFIYVEKWDIYR